jgi:hypothetical protein
MKLSKMVRAQHREEMNNRLLGGLETKCAKLLYKAIGARRIPTDANFAGFATVSSFPFRFVVDPQAGIETAQFFDRPEKCSVLSLFGELLDNFNKVHGHTGMGLVVPSAKYGYGLVLLLSEYAPKGVTAMSAVVKVNGQERGVAVCRFDRLAEALGGK